MSKEQWQKLKAAEKNKNKGKQTNAQAQGEVDAGADTEDCYVLASLADHDLCGRDH